MITPLTDHQHNTLLVKSLLSDLDIKGGRRKRIHKLLDDNDDIAEVLADLEVGNIEGQAALAKVLFWEFNEREED